MVDAVPTPTPTPLLDAIRARAEICVLRTTLSAEMACGVCAANVRCLELERVCMRIDLVLSSSIDHTVSFYDDSDVLTPSLFFMSPPDDAEPEARREHQMPVRGPEHRVTQNRTEHQTTRLGVRSMRLQYGA